METTPSKENNIYILIKVCDKDASIIYAYET